MIEAVFFDLGDTIVDLREGQPDYQQRLAARAGQIYDLLDAAAVSLPARAAFCAALAEETEGRYQAAVAQQRGIGIRAVLAALFAGLGLSVDAGLLDASVEAYCGGGSAETQAPLRVGAREALDSLYASGLRLGVISNTIQPGRYMDRSLAGRGLLRYFATRTYSSEVGVAKPHPGIFRAALSEMGVKPERAVHVGDRLYADVYGAQAAGMRAVFIRAASRDPHESGAARGLPEAEIVPNAAIAELSELPAALAGLDRP